MLKNKLCSKLPNPDGDYIYEVSKKLENEEFKRTLREQQGIYFDVNVYPSSPKKVISPKQNRSKTLQNLMKRKNADSYGKKNEDGKAAHRTSPSIDSEDAAANENKQETEIEMLKVFSDKINEIKKS